MTEAHATFANDTHDSKDLDLGLSACSQASITRTFAGDLTGKSRAELLVCSPIEGVFGYAGMDVFAGTLSGRDGSFAFHHAELFEGGPTRSIGFIVPGSGTGALKGLRGDVAIHVEDDVHHVTLTYDFGDAAQ